MNQLVSWRKKAITELEELRGALKSKEEHHLRKTNAKDRNLKLQNDDYNHQIDSFKQKLVTMSKKLKIKTLMYCTQVHCVCDTVLNSLAA